MNEELIKALPRLVDRDVLVVGDLMLDEYIWSTVSHISPEAPVPVAEVTSTAYVPGGAGNVARNIKALGGKVHLIGVVGKDSSGERLLRELKQLQIGTEGILIDKSRPTTLKSRIIAHHQHVLRVDRETKKAVDRSICGKILELSKRAMDKVGAVLISDYNKGLMTVELTNKIVALAREYGKIVSVDPKGNDYLKYKGATIIVPNRKEAELSTGIVIDNKNSLLKAGYKLLQETEADYILITRGDEGMSLFKKNHLPIHIPSVVSEVYDITGAGDTVIATLTLALAGGVSSEKAIKIASWAAGVVVKKVGTAIVTIEELEEFIRFYGTGDAKRKIRSVEELEKLVKRSKKESKKIIFTNGCFDLLHLGHVKYLQEAKNLGDVLIVGVNTDSSAKKIKGDKRPLVSEEERIQLVAAMESVDYVVLFSETTPERIISLIRPDIHVKGGDYKVEGLPERKIVEKYGGKTVVVNKIEGKSTSSLINLILRRFSI